MTGTVHSFDTGCNSVRVKEIGWTRGKAMSYNIPHFPVTQSRKWGLDRLIVEVSRSHTFGRTHPLGFLWMSEQPVSLLYAQRTSTPSAEFEPAVPALKRLQTYASDIAATVMVSLSLSYTIINVQILPASLQWPQYFIIIMFMNG